MAGLRAYFDFRGNSNPDRVRLSPDESRHLCGSLRAQAGDEVDVFDLSGCVKHCKIAVADRKRAELDVLGGVEIRKPETSVFVAQCMPKGKVFDDIIRQSVEVGAAGIFPLVSDRTLVRPDGADKDKKLDKWTAHIVEAVKQSANFSGFEMAQARSFSEFIAGAADAFDLKIVASLQPDSKPIFDVLESAPDAKSVCVLIGPEGDMTPAEYAAAAEAGFRPATLGINVMKCDTAALFALSAASAYFAR